MPGVDETRSQMKTIFMDLYISYNLRVNTIFYNIYII